MHGELLKPSLTRRVLILRVRHVLLFSFYHCQMPPFFFLCMLDPINDFKVLTRFCKISFLSFIFRYIFKITSTSNTRFPVFFKPACLLIAIFLKFIFNQKENHYFIWLKTFNFLFRRKRCSLKIAVLEPEKDQKDKKITFNFSKIF